MKKLFEKMEDAAWTALDLLMTFLAAVIIFGNEGVWRAWAGLKALGRWAGDTLKRGMLFVARVTLVSAFFLGGGLAFLYAPGLLPVPNAWAETARGAQAGGGPDPIRRDRDHEPEELDAYFEASARFVRQQTAKPAEKKPLPAAKPAAKPVAPKV